MKGTVTFLAQPHEVNEIVSLVDENDDFLQASTQELDGPLEFQHFGNGVLYRCEFNDDQWIDVERLVGMLKDEGIDVDCIHAITDGNTFVEVVSSNNEYDAYEDNDIEQMQELANLYQLEFFGSEEQVDEDEDDMMSLYYGDDDY